MLFHDEVLLVAFDDGLRLGQLMSGHDDEAPRVRADRFVFLTRYADVVVAAACPHSQKKVSRSPRIAGAWFSSQASMRSLPARNSASISATRSFCAHSPVPTRHRLIQAIKTERRCCRTRDREEGKAPKRGFVAARLLRDLARTGGEPCLGARGLRSAHVHATE